MIYDCRKTGREPGARSFPCNVRIVDPVNGERIPNVFYVSTSPARIGRFVAGTNGEPLVNRAKWKMVGSNDERLILIDTPEKAVLDSKRAADPLDHRLYERLEVWESRPWVAIAIATNEVIARSEEVIHEVASNTQA